MYQGVIIIIKADNRINMYDLNKAIFDMYNFNKDAQRDLALDILYPKPRYNKSLIKKIHSLNIGMFESYYNNESDTFKIYCPFFLVERKFLTEKHNNKDYGTGIIPLMENLGYTFQNTEFSAVKKSSGRKANPTITLSFKDTRRGPAIDIPLDVRRDNPKLPASQDLSFMYRKFVYNDFRKAKNLFKEYMILAQKEKAKEAAKKARYKNKSRKFTDNETFTDPKEKARKELGIENPNPSRKEVLKAYKEKALKHHPDKCGDVEKMKKINDAKTTLLPNGLYKLKF